MTAGTGFDPQDVLDRLVSHAVSTGYFEQVNASEPMNAPEYGLFCAIWATRMTPVDSSGLNSTSIRVIYNARIFALLNQQPQESIDPRVMAAQSALMKAYVGDFDFGGTARNLDVFGEHNGIGLDARLGYANMQGTDYRVSTTTIPIVFNDVFDQVE